MGKRVMKKTKAPQSAATTNCGCGCGLSPVMKK